MLHNASTLAFVPSARLKGDEAWPHVAVITSAEEIPRIFRNPSPELQWVRVEGLIGDASVWAMLAQGNDGIQIDVVIETPET